MEGRDSSSCTFRQRQMELGDCSSTSTARQMELGDCSTFTGRQQHREPEKAFDGIAQASPSYSTLTNEGSWDVFINHRGCDVKHKLASTIYHTLDLLGLRAFLDVEELELGDSIPQEIEKAMTTSALHIAIFSENYAQSPWCLAELSFMLKTGTTILPVYYHVQPDDLRWVAQGKGCYAHAFSEHEEKGRYSTSKLEEWKTALQRVSYISGYMLNSNNDDEGMLLKSIVNSVLRVMKKEPLEVAKHPVGMDEIVQEFERSRQEYMERNKVQVQVVGIVGFGGSGKTTLATELYNRKSSSFHRSSFLHDVRDATSKNALHTKQKKLLEDLRIPTLPFDNVRKGKRFLEKYLTSFRLLIVLDDVDHEDELDALLPPKQNLGSGSLVIVTTRAGDVLTKWGIASIYRMQPLQRFHAKQLFCWHAFLQPSPLIGFEDLVENFLNVCNGLPLSLKVIGGQLYGKRSKDYWVSQLDKIRRILPKEIMERLKVSYDALDEEEKEIFLDIACFFIGERRSSAITVLDGSGWSGLYSWETLHNKCLVEVDEKECIRMHDHLRDLGRQIAKTHSPSRMWPDQRQIMHIQRGMPIRGIMASTVFAWGKSIRLDCPPPFKEYLDMVRNSNLRVGLQLILVRGNEFTEECAELSRGLLWLRWFNFQHGYIPSWLSPENIRILELIDPRLETLWEDAHPPFQLRELLIEEATKLQSLPKSIGHLKHLKRLSLIDYHHGGFALMSLPEEFCRLHSLEHLVLRGCNNLSSLPNHFGDLVNLRHVNLSSCSRLEMLPISFKQLIHLEYFDLSNCCRLTLQSHLLEKITNLKVLDVSLCSNLEVLPQNITNQASLEKLDLRYAMSFKELPANIGQLTKLKKIEIVRCPLLTRLPISFRNWTHVKDCNKIEKIEGLEHLTSLEKMLVWTCWTVPGIHSLGGTERLRLLNLKSESISAFEACIQSIQIEKWPQEMTICGRVFDGVQSILDSFTFPGLVVVSSLEKVDSTRVDYSLWAVFGRWNLKCRETNLSNAAIVCYLVKSDRHKSFEVSIEEGESTRLELSGAEWIVTSVFREVSPLIKDGGRYLQPSIDVIYGISGHGDYKPSQVYGGWLIVGEKDSIVEGFKQLFKTLCKATSMSSIL